MAQTLPSVGSKNKSRMLPGFTDRHKKLQGRGQNGDGINKGAKKNKKKNKNKPHQERMEGESPSAMVREDAPSGDANAQKPSEAQHKIASSLTERKKRYCCLLLYMICLTCPTHC